MRIYDRLVANKVANTTGVVANISNPVDSQPGYVQVACNATSRGGAGTKHGVYADKDRRKAYMREYMRKRRITVAKKNLQSSRMSDADK